MRLLCIPLLALPLAGQITHATATPKDAAAAFAAFYGQVEKQSAGPVTIERMIDAMNAADGDPKSLARIKAWDTNRDGLIDRKEGAAGAEGEILATVKEQMAADADGDGALSAAEYALAVPDAQGEKSASGLTKRQQIMFASGDADKNGSYSRNEAVAANSYRHYHSFLGRAAAFRARVLDRNRNGIYELDEFASLYGIAPGQPVVDEIRTKFGAGNHTYYRVMMRIIHMPLEEIQELDTRLDKAMPKASKLGGGAPVSLDAAIASLHKLFDAIDSDGDGKVTLAAIFEALTMQEAEARQVKSIRGLDRNGDGVVARTEAAEGLRSQIETQVSRGMNTDADGDGSLTPQEYALSFPDPGGKADAEGLTPAQLRGFQAYDSNGDGKVTRGEVEGVVNRSFESSFWRQRIGMRARKADRNGDGYLDEAEFEWLEGRPLSEQSRKRFADAGAKDGRLKAASVPFLFLAAEAEGRAAVEASLDAFERRRAGRVTSAEGK
jgi:Ca2+-binding EF-hand superfamily protein